MCQYSDDRECLTDDYVARGLIYASSYNSRSYHKPKIKRRCSGHGDFGGALVLVW